MHGKESHFKLECRDCAWTEWQQVLDDAILDSNFQSQGGDKFLVPSGQNLQQKIIGCRDWIDITSPGYGPLNGSTILKLLKFT